MNGLHQQFAQIERKITTVHYSVDRIIDQMEHVKMLLSNPEIIDDLDAQLEGVVSKQDFIDDLGL